MRSDLRYVRRDLLEVSGLDPVARYQIVLAGH